MEGLMQDWPLLVHTVLDHASTYHGEREIVSRTVEGPIHRYTYKDLNRARASLPALSGKDRHQVRVTWSAPWRGTATGIWSAGMA